ncbi:MAG TPA: D-alanyl-D-alanine carboxypeptidase [Caldimonas sp.]|jgi:D-alanyl-D-alanine carboxypeptidase/D-alanyl-D-alanine-endopeptidase (penicillin-binding protein 4)|nr:D-alanyl-D-alanine carboxypeptidase [Caldimonas sp.]HEX2542369.1 D-alanyl-D-alanine carboxypeptidase [Caldimonas sp.]
MPCPRSIARLLGAALGLLLAVEPSSALAARADGARPKPARARTTSAVPAPVASILRVTGLPESSFGLHVRSVESADVPPLLALNAERPFLLASTTKLVTSLAALDVLGAEHRWQTSAHATGPVAGGRLAGDLVIRGGAVGLTGHELRRWFAQMRDEGLQSIGGNIVLHDVALLHERDPKQLPATEEEREPDAPMDGRTYNQGKLLVRIGPSTGERAVVTLTPRPANVVVVNDVFMGGGCAAWARWKRPDEVGPGPALQLWVRGRWSAECPAEDIAHVASPADARFDPTLGTAPTLPIAAPTMVAELWSEAGGSLAGRVVERDHAPARRDGRWSSELSTPVTEVLREMNKTSNNEAARSVLLSLAGDAATPARRRGGVLPAAQERMRGWLRTQGLRDGDLTVVVGSGESRAERGKPQALVELLRKAWQGPHGQSFIDSLPIAGVDGTLVHRMTGEATRGRAFLKTGTLSDTRALAGYVRAQSGKVYAVTLIVSHAEAAAARPALDAIVAWIARSG